MKEALGYFRWFQISISGAMQPRCCNAIFGPGGNSHCYLARTRQFVVAIVHGKLLPICPCDVPKPQQAGVLHVRPHLVEHCTRLLRFGTSSVVPIGPVQFCADRRGLLTVHSWHLVEKHDLHIVESLLPPHRFAKSQVGMPETSISRAAAASVLTKKGGWVESIWD